MKLKEKNLNDEILKNQLDEFLGSRHLERELKEHLIQLKRPLNMELYRGMMFPIHLLTIGQILDEWYDSSHWSKDFDVALGFAYDGYISEGFVEELEENTELLKAHRVSSSSELFKPVVFKLKTNSQAIDTHRLVNEYGLENWRREKEVTFIGMDFILRTIEFVEGDKPYYLVDVEEI